MRDLYEKIFKELSKEGVNAKITVVDRSAMEFYGFDSILTKEIEFEFFSDDKGWKVLLDVLRNIEAKAYFGENVSMWSVIPLPDGYGKRTILVMKEGLVEVCVLDPLDYIFLRLRIGTVEDELDSFKIAKMFSLTEYQFKERFSLIKQVKDIQFFLFQRRFESFLGSLRDNQK